MRALLILGALAAVVGGAGCDSNDKGLARSPAPRRAPERRPAATPPAKAETIAQIARSRVEALRMTRALLEAGIATREVTAIADIRGYRLFRRSHFHRALAWFEVGANIDPSYEPCVYNAARAAAELGDGERVRRYLDQLRILATPMAKRRLERAKRELLAQ